MNKLRIKKEFKELVLATDSKLDDKIIKNLWKTYLLFLHGSGEISHPQYIELYKEF